MSDLFTYAAAADERQRLNDSREYRWVRSLARGHFKPTPTEPVWQWADKNVFLSGKMAARAGRYDSRLTPWTREMQDLIRNPDVHECGVMKSSRTGVSEAWFNVMRWMPEHKPGHALYAINEDKLARKINKRRFLPSLKATCPDVFTGDKDDEGLSVLSLKNMDIMFSGSGSASQFMEVFYRLIVLDELENHLQTQETTTEQRAESRQNDVDDGLIAKISKPEEAGGIIDLAYIRGTQKRFWVPCPRCSDGNAAAAYKDPAAARFMLLTREGVVANHCRNPNDGTWDLERVIKETYRTCPYCQGRIEEWEKRSMVDAGVQVPTPMKDRRRGPDGKPVPPVPGVESYHISDWYSLHRKLTTGHMMAKYLVAFEIQPTESGKKYFTVNHEGWPWDVTDYKVDETSIDALKGGRVEQQEVTAADGTKQTITVVLGTKFHLAYDRDGKFQSRLPFRPALLSVHTDKQKHCLKSWVVAWMNNGERYVIDVCQWQDEEHMFKTLARRPYWIAKAYRVDADKDEPMYVRCGRIDSGYRPTDVYKACIAANSGAYGGLEYGAFQVWPVRGEGDEDKQGGKKLMRFTKDYVGGAEIVVRMFWDHEVKNNFYISRIQQRAAPRLWFPDNLPRQCYDELTSEKFNPVTKAWEHPEGAPPNDFGDVGKQTELFWEEEGNSIRAMDCAYPHT
ncbi:MAG: phage terminase large subunit family protein [Verrucomicrobiaceae bacterium]|nr:phage terminase large subunit family protein [Verrucomicrobiaceae bacterium]